MVKKVVWKKEELLEGRVFLCCEWRKRSREVNWHVLGLQKKGLNIDQFMASLHMFFM